MLDQAPRRPALLPAILFLAAAWATPPPTVLLLGLGAVVWILHRRLLRRFDAALLILLAILGTFAGWDADRRRAQRLGDAAISLPIGVPFERSWAGSLVGRPQRIDRLGWLVVVDARPLRLRLELPTPTVEERERLARLSAGQRVRLWARVRIDAETGTARGWVKSSRLIERLDGTVSSPRYIVQRVRDRLQDRLATLYGHNEEELGFLSAVLLGQRSARAPDLEARLRASGLAHLLAISGLHVGIVGGFLVSAARRASRSPWLRAAVAGGMLVAFGAVVGGAVPVVRAVAAVLVLLVGEALGREGEPLNRLACLVISLGLMLPDRLPTPAFALSFAATAGILIALDGDDGAPPQGQVSAAVRISCAAYLATAPLSAMHFGQLAPWALVTNLLAVPCLMLLLAGGYASLLLADVPVVVDVTVVLTRTGFAGIDAIARLVDGLPASPMFVARIDSLECAFVCCLALAGWLAKPRPIRIVARASFALSIVWLHLGPPPVVPGGPVALLLDVGQGQALLWRDEKGTTLIDAAGRGYGRWDPGGRVVRPALLERGIRRIDRLVLSHGDADHAAGAFALIEAFEIGELWLGPQWWADPRLGEIAAAAHDRGAAVRLVARGDAEDGLRVLAPGRHRGGRDGNARSLVLTLGVDPWTLFVPGDLDGAPLERFLATESVPAAGALVLAHHGSRRGTPDGLLDRLRPHVAVVSCGRRNRFGHPDPLTVRRLSERGVPLWRTDHHGTIRLEAQPQGWVVEAER
ncbi:MAG: MBL fold metallo-hydrolase [Acidobacteria bacterium]|nr:MBL fold metallo-hydrolase [Acidobacteriota bacterium]NIM62891.1 MBL fold metallo-hydrolase [Acidobacteriota bacterium]NIO58834.1 MBL fold metallo-hydrolase [Acidobacteriota bacterium]NIQ29891.1 MBL fold metallo-hydrolase [Acidobacteriota bacterium]NIQ84615.1 MBL fold metallo-hydrolase [Acidobacteriota bacterium]